MKLTALQLLFSIVFCFGNKLPSTYKKCNKNQEDFNQCLTTAIKDAIHQLSTPQKELGLPSLEPLEIPLLVIGAGTGPVQFQQNYEDLKIFGWTHFTSLDADLKDNILKLDVIYPEIKMMFNYNVSGRILVLPISGNGKGVITITQPKYSLAFYLEEYEQKRKKYYKVIKQTMSIEPQKMFFELGNLFNGEKSLSENLIQVMNDNWKEIFGDVRPSYEDALGQIFASIFNHLLSKVPISELFGGA